MRIVLASQALPEMAFRHLYFPLNMAVCNPTKAHAFGSAIFKFTRYAMRTGVVRLLIG